MKKVMFLASRFPYPGKSGRERTLLEYLSFLKGNSEVYFYFFGKKELSKDLIANFRKEYCLKEVKFLKLPSLLFSLLRVLNGSLIQHKKSIQENIFYSRAIEKFLVNELYTKNIDIIFTDMIRTAHYFEYINKKGILKIFDMDDMISKRYKYLQAQKDINILGSFSENLPTFISMVVEKIIRKFVLKLEEKLVEKRELELINKYDKTILVSPKEASLLRKKTGKYNIYYVYPSVKTESINLTIEKIYPSISFMGLLNVPHNEKALLKFIKEIFPEIKRIYPDIKFYIAGANPTEKIREEVAKYSSNIILLGYVKDFKNYLMKTNIFVAPIYFGTGIKTKILDAMSLRMPVVTTPIGVEGLKVRHLENIIIVRNKKEFINFIDLLLKDKNLRESIGRKAYQYVKEFHSYEKIKKRFLGILGIN